MDRLIARELKPVLFPVLSYGVNDDRYYLNSLHYSADVFMTPAGQGLVKGSDQASKFMSIMRLGGYDATVSDGFTCHKNWAANSNGHCMAIPPTEVNINRDYQFETSQIIKRRMSWIDDAWMTRGRVKLTVDIRPYGYVLFYNGSQAIMDVKNYIPIGPDDRLLKESEVLGLTVTTNDGKMPYRYSDFLFRQTLVEPETAESLLALSDIKQSLPIELSLEQDSSTQVGTLDQQLEC